MSKDKILLGKNGEDRAVKFLTKKGYDIVERNYRSSHGEIDIIAKNESRIVFIEVKTRKDTSFGEPEESIDYNKKKHIINCAEYYMQENYDRDVPVDFEVIAITEQENISIRHLKLFD